MLDLFLMKPPDAEEEDQSQEQHPGQAQSSSSSKVRPLLINGIIDVLTIFI
jgi:hypothetical protein